MLVPPTVLAVLLGPGVPEVDVAWDGPPACIDAASVPARVDAFLGETEPPAASLRLAATAQDGEWVVDLRLTTQDAEIRRDLHGDDCETLTAAVALVTAVHLDAVAVAERTTATPSPPVSSLPPPPSTAETPPPAAAAEPLPAVTATRRPDADPGPRTARPPREAVRPRALLSAGVAGELGIVPRIGASFELSTGVRWPRAKVELGGLATIGPDVTPLVGDAGRADFGLYAGTVRGCGILRRDRVELPLCGSTEIGTLRTVADGPGVDATIDALWVALGVGARPQWVVVPRVAVGGIIDLVAPLRRHRYSVGNGETVHAVAPVAARLGIGVRVRLP